jgi:hypothetical protein
LKNKRSYEVKKNYVEVSIPTEVYNRLREWLDKDDILNIGTDRQGHLVLMNEREQREYEARGYKDN